MKYEHVDVGILGVNCGIVYDEETMEGILIDPGSQEEKIRNAVDAAGMKPKAILLTHGHFDHIMAVDQLRMYYNVPVLIGEHEYGLVMDPKLNQGLRYMRREVCVQPDILLKDNEIVKFCGGIRVIWTPGHTPGGVCFYFENDKVLFAGDTLFSGSIGRTESDDETELLIGSIKDRLLPLPDDVLVIPGHGPETTIGQERIYNPFLN